MSIHPDAIYSALAGVAIGGITAPVLFPMAAGVKTASLIAGIAASGTLAYGHQSGAIERGKKRYAIQRDSEHEVWIQQQASREALALKRIDVEELVETLVMLDQLTPYEQRHFLKELNLLELLPLYQPPIALPALEPVAIEVPAATAEEASPFAESLQWNVDAILNQAAQTTQQGLIVDDTFPEVDLGKAIAEMMVAGDVPLSVMLACPPRTGKTTTLSVAIAWLHKLTQGNAQVKIFNGKELRDLKTGQLKDRFLGLVDDPKRYQAVEDLETAKDFADEFDEISQSMKQPRQFPQVLLLDEFNNIRQRINGYDQLNGIPKAKGNLIKTDVNTGLIATQGSSRGLFLLITSHSAYVKNIGIDRSYQDGLYSIVLGRGGALDAVYKSLKGSTAVVQNTARANALLQELSAWENSPTRDHSKVVALTNLVDGNFGLYFVKYIDLSKVGFEPIATQPAAEPKEDPYEFWDSEFEDGFGHQPEDDPRWKEPASLPSKEELVKTLSSWVKELGRSPTDSELIERLRPILKITPNGDTLSDIKTLMMHNGITLIDDRELLDNAAKKAEGTSFSPEYFAYLDSPYWQERRDRIKPKQCAGCNTVQRLQLHHRCYPPKGSSLQAFIDQPDSEFTWLCELCHKAITTSMRGRSKE